MKKQNKNYYNHSGKGRFGEKNISQNSKRNIYLPNDLKRALDNNLRINQAEQKSFFMYLSFATNNIFEIAGISHDFSTDGIKVWNEIKRLKMVDKVARFLWLFRIENPSKQGAVYPTFSLWIFFFLPPREILTLASDNLSLDILKP